MLAYKGFDIDLSCTRGRNKYRYEIGVTAKEPTANCAHNGFHCAEDPLDCFTYYPDVKRSRYCIVVADGDVDEDGVDSKISCTELTPIKELTLVQMIYHAIVFITKHPDRVNKAVSLNNGSAVERGWVVVKGVHPMAKAVCGDVVALIADDPVNPGRVLQAAVKRVHNPDMKPHYYIIRDNRVV